jgi:geranylgeranyl pyrophosphate synthase
MLDEARAVTETRLRAIALRLRRQHPGRLGEGFEYALGTIGKRVRPALVLASYRAAGGASPAIDGVGAAVEIVHTYSLVHDDLPCMDDDDQRRGRPTTHVQFDVEIASLIGWLLVPVAVEQLLEACGELKLTTGVAARMAVTILEAGGIRGMIGGQWLDLEAEGQARDLDGVMEIHRRKTGALIEASCVLGALAAGAAEEEITSLAGYGREIGLAFQIADDILDATATTSQLGKTAGRDMALAKSTYVGLLGVEGARREAERRAELAIGHLTPALSSKSLTGLARYIVSRSS